MEIDSSKNKVNKSRLLVIILIVSIVLGGSIAGFFIWDHQKTIERKYQACLEKCEAFVPLGSRYFQTQPSKYMVCVAQCKEKYAK